MNNTKIIQTKSKTKYNVEFFHIYTDEKINNYHISTLKYLQDVKKSWNFDFDLILLIDDYNPEKNILNITDLFKFLKKSGYLPDFYAYEKDLVPIADKLLANIDSKKLKKNYLKYIEKNDKYPCSLLTASWYLLRMGAIKNDQIIKSLGTSKYKYSNRIINILPKDYKPVELRAFKLIKNSIFSDYLNNIQDLLVQETSGRELNLW